MRMSWPSSSKWVANEWRSVWGWLPCGRRFCSSAIVPDAEGLADAVEQPRLGQHGRHRLADGARARVAGLDGIHQRPYYRS